MRPSIGVSSHARQRAVERLGRDLRRQEWRAVVLDIVEQRALLLSRDEEGTEVYLVDVGAMTFRVVWRPWEAVIITVLPTDTPALSVQADAARHGRMRPSFVRPHFFRRGKRRQGGTEWRE